MGRRGCSPEFRRKVLDLVEAGYKVADVAWIWRSASSRSAPGGGRTALIVVWKQADQRGENRVGHGRTKDRGAKATSYVVIRESFL